MNKKDNGQKQIQNEIINLQKQLLGAQYLLDRLKLSLDQQEKDQQQVAGMQLNLRAYFKVLSEKIPSDQETKRKYAQQLLQSDPQIGSKQFQIRQLISVNQQLQKAERKLLIKQHQQNQAAKRYYKYMKPNKPQQIINKFIKQKLIKNIQNLQNQISQVYEVGGRSSISSSSIGNYGIEDWINQQKQQKIIKEQEKLMEEIAFLEKELQKL